MIWPHRLGYKWIFCSFGCPWWGTQRTRGDNFHGSEKGQENRIPLVPEARAQLLCVPACWKVTITFSGALQWGNNKERDSHCSPPAALAARLPWPGWGFLCADGQDCPELSWGADFPVPLNSSAHCELWVCSYGITMLLLKCQSTGMERIVLCCVGVTFVTFVSVSVPSAVT